MCLINHALAQCEVRVGQVGEGLQQDLGSDCGLKEGWVELVPGKGKKRQSLSSLFRYRRPSAVAQSSGAGHTWAPVPNSILAL